MGEVAKWAVGLVKWMVGASGYIRTIILSTCFSASRFLICAFSTLSTLLGSAAAVAKVWHSEQCTCIWFYLLADDLHVGRSAHVQCTYVHVQVTVSMHLQGFVISTCRDASIHYGTNIPIAWTLAGYFFFLWTSIWLVQWTITRNTLCMISCDVHVTSTQIARDQHVHSKFQISASFYTAIAVIFPYGSLKCNN